jgi:hypothetical protein
MFLSLLGMVLLMGHGMVDLVCSLLDTLVSLEGGFVGRLFGFPEYSFTLASIKLV